MASPAGFGPATPALGKRCSIQLSYEDRRRLRLAFAETVRKRDLFPVRGGGAVDDDARRVPSSHLRSLLAAAFAALVAVVWLNQGISVDEWRSYEATHS